MNFRPAQITDLARLRELEQGVVEAERPFNANIRAGQPHYYDLDALISSPKSLLLVAEDLGRIEDTNQIVACGYAQIRESKPYFQHPQHCYLGFMYVEPNHRGKALIQQIMQRLLTWSQDKNINTFYLDVYAQNTAAIRA